MNYFISRLGGVNNYACPEVLREPKLDLVTVQYVKVHACDHISWNISWQCYVETVMLIFYSRLILARFGRVMPADDLTVVTQVLDLRSILSAMQCAFQLKINHCKILMIFVIFAITIFTLFLTFSVCSFWTIFIFFYLIALLVICCLNCCGNFNWNVMF